MQSAIAIRSVPSHDASLSKVIPSSKLNDVKTKPGDFVQTHDSTPSPNLDTIASEIFYKINAYLEPEEQRSLAGVNRIFRHRIVNDAVRKIQFSNTSFIDASEVLVFSNTFWENKYVSHEQGTQAFTLFRKKLHEDCPLPSSREYIANIFPGVNDNVHDELLTKVENLVSSRLGQEVGTDRFYEALFLVENIMHVIAACDPISQSNFLKRIVAVPNVKFLAQLIKKEDDRDALYTENPRISLMSVLLSVSEDLRGEVALQIFQRGPEKEIDHDLASESHYIGAAGQVGCNLKKYPSEVREEVRKLIKHLLTPTFLDHLIKRTAYRSYHPIQILRREVDLEKMEASIATLSEKEQKKWKFLTAHPMLS